MQAYARSFAEQGGQVKQASVEDVLQVEGGWQVKTSEGDLEAEQVVVAMGPWTGELLTRLGMKVPLFVNAATTCTTPSKTRPSSTTG